MANLAVILLAPGPMADNFERSLSEPKDHPWAFDRPKTQMRGIRPDDVYVLFVDAAQPNGKGLGRQGPIELSTMIRRVVIGRVSSGVAERAQPFFANFPFQFTYQSPDDLELPDGTELPAAAGVISARISGLALTGDHLRELISTARSAKVSMYYDGAPQRASFFKDFPEIPVLGSTSAPGAVADDQAPQPDQPPAGVGPLFDAAQHFTKAVADSGLVFDDLNAQLPRAFFAALAAKRFAILTGMSGSGKTQLARAFGQWLGVSKQRLRYLVVPVRADWTSPEPILGYEDALLPAREQDNARAWTVPGALDFILAARQDTSHAWLLVLDEMNLAHVERYFADVLSGIESGEPIVPNLERDGKTGRWYPAPGEEPLVPLPPNLLIIGTVNVDETTYQFSPKVLDRAFSFEFRVQTEELRTDLAALQPVAGAPREHVAAFMNVLADPKWQTFHPHPDVESLATLLRERHGLMQEINLEFGHRTFFEALRFAATLAAVGIGDAEQAWDWVMMTKILPRVHGSRRQLDSFLASLALAAAGADENKPEWPLAHRKVGRMRRSLETNQFASFSD
jgi:hypothetical protein